MTSAPLHSSDMALAPRGRRLESLEQRKPDVVIVGGGITGAGLALDLSLRGLDVVIVERGDWAAATSSASSRLIHGGLRYLEQFDFGLVRESCLERGLLLRNAAGLVWPERFTFPIHRGGPVGKWKLMAGLWLYTAVSIPRVLGLPHSRSSTELLAAVPGMETGGASHDSSGSSRIALGALLGGGDYLDGATDDARLTLAVVATAMEAGALAISRLEATHVESSAAGVRLTLRDRLADAESEFVIDSRCAVLAGGPGTDALRARAGLAGKWLDPTRGSHVLVPRSRLPTDGAVILNSPVDGRVMFLIPRPRFTLIGTTDLDADPESTPRATRAEVRYLLDSANSLVPEAELTLDDVTSTYAGLRPLLAAKQSDPSARTREERSQREGCIYTIAGGKLTGYRAMAEKLGARIAEDLGKGSAARRSPTRARRLRAALEAPVARPAWSRWNASDVSAAARDELATAWSQRYASLAPEVRRATQGSDSAPLLLSPDTCLAEVDWAVTHEDCLRAGDFLFRRTDLGLEATPDAERAAARVVERMAELLHWDAQRCDRELADALAEIRARSAWRDAQPTDG